MKNVFILIVFMHLAKSANSKGFTFQDRQWMRGDFVDGRGDVTQECRELCEEECPPCNVTTTCKPEEATCGKKSQEGSPDCMYAVCAPVGCDCQRGPTNCTMDVICHPLCSETEKRCAVDPDENGCEQSDICVPICTGVCPVKCAEHELHCPTPDNPKTGCKNPAQCYPKEKCYDGEYNPDQECPLFCEESEHLCPGEVDQNGCKKPDQCVPKPLPPNCPGTCPANCDEEDEIVCNGQKITGTECFESDFCKPRAPNVNGEPCPDDSASHGCPVECEDGFIPCVLERPHLSCEGPITCVKIEYGNGTTACPDVCRNVPLCENDEVACETNEKDENGCKKPDICIPCGTDYDGEPCDCHCPLSPPDCNEDQILCPGVKKENGCKEPDSCVERTTKQWGREQGDLCPGVCPIDSCKNGELLCPRQLDCNGCPEERICVVKQKDENGVYCPDDSASHGCPKRCYSEEHQSNINHCPCTSKENEIGCKDEELCVPRGKSTSGEYCPLSGVCEVQCSFDETLCQMGIDSEGCKIAGVCVETKMNFDEEPCDRQCPHICEESQISCSVEPLSNGCPGLNECVDRGSFGTNRDGKQCPAYCTPRCSEGKVLKENGHDDKGCKIPPTCAADCNDDIPATCEIRGGPFNCTTLLQHLEELEEETYPVDEFCGLSWSYIDGCSDTPGFINSTCHKFCGNCA